MTMREIMMKKLADDYELEKIAEKLADEIAEELELEKIAEVVADYVLGKYAYDPEELIELLSED